MSDLPTIAAAVGVVATVVASTWQLSARLSRLEAAIAGLRGRFDEHCRGHETWIEVTPPGGKRMR